MDNRLFAVKMLELEELLKSVKRLETELADHVLKRQQTFEIGNVTAKYNPGRTTYDWEATVKEHPSHRAEPEAWAELVEQYTKTTQVTTTNWRKIAQDMKWEGKETKPPTPTVNFQLVEADDGH